MGSGLCELGRTSSSFGLCGGPPANHRSGASILQALRYIAFAA